jgi:hypothetical protein
MARRLNCDLHLPTSNVERHSPSSSDDEKLSTLQHEDFPDDSQYTSFNFLDDRTIGCKIDETRVHAPVMRMPLLEGHERGKLAMATALMDARTTMDSTFSTG